jgi:hypothetical protein
MNTQLATTEAYEQTARRTWRMRLVGVLGPATVAIGFAWALFQPYRVTLLHPRGQGFWWLAVEPPLLVIAVGLLFAWLVAPGLVRDLEDAEA